MHWKLKSRALERGITTAAALRRVLAAHGLVISAGKMSGMWSGTPLTIRLQDLEVICTALACYPSDLLAPEGRPASHAALSADHRPAATEGPAARARPARRDGAEGRQPSHQLATEAASRRDQTAPARRLVPPL
ncbi:helix-turn-helix domain-containing protein [Streptomyces sp. NPDC060011]|uniref:helix-turn-helix domain-containing protein n=1 Tax=Streptomyces sp. NPDC060011 TaxID=3347037 RepID=UPI0036C25B67